MLPSSGAQLEPLGTQRGFEEQEIEVYLGRRRREGGERVGYRGSIGGFYGYYRTGWVKGVVSSWKRRDLYELIQVRHEESFRGIYHARLGHRVGDLEGFLIVRFVPEEGGLKSCAGDLMYARNTSRQTEVGGNLSLVETGCSATGTSQFLLSYAPKFYGFKCSSIRRSRECYNGFKCE